MNSLLPFKPLSFFKDTLEAPGDARCWRDSLDHCGRRRDVSLMAFDHDSGRVGTTLQLGLQDRHCFQVGKDQLIMFAHPYADRNDPRNPSSNEHRPEPQGIL